MTKMAAALSSPSSRALARGRGHAAASGLSWNTPAACHSLWAAFSRSFLPDCFCRPLPALSRRPLNPFCLLWSFPLPPAALALWPLHLRHQCTSANAMAPTLSGSRATSMPLEKSAAAGLCIASATATICCTFGRPPRSGSLQALRRAFRSSRRHHRRFPRPGCDVQPVARARPAEVARP